MPGDERIPAFDQLCEYLRDHFLSGSSDVRVIFDPVARQRWDRIEGATTRRWPEGDVKVERLALGLAVEWVRTRD